MSDDNSKNSLLLFQLGPVQSFIAQAETLGDLAVGSSILSEVTAAAIQSFDGWQDALVFPSPKDNPELKGIPNRFLMFVPKGRGEEIAEACEDAARNKLSVLATETHQIFKRDHPGKLDNPIPFLQQVNHFLQITWAVLEEPTGDMGKDYKAIGKLMAMRRNTREFDAWLEAGYGQKKDFLSGKEVALLNGRGAMNLIKQFRAEQEADQFEIPEGLCKEKYIAVIAMDGDQMGKTLSGFKNIDGHRKFSEQLGAFAIAVAPIIEEFAGQLIYAGGDDVLAIVPAKKAVTCAAKLSNLFSENVKNKNSESLTASAGIAIGHSSVPLQDLVHAAHDAESRAKKTYGRNALAISIYKRSGEILEWGCKWGSKALDVYGELFTLSTLHNEEQINIGRFPYKLAALLQPYALKGEVDKQMQAIVMAEYDHAVEQTKDMRDEHKRERLTRDYVTAYLEECCKDKDGVSAKPEDFLNLFMAETFINRQREGEDD